MVTRCSSSHCQTILGGWITYGARLFSHYHRNSKDRLRRRTLQRLKQTYRNLANQRYACSLGVTLLWQRTHTLGRSSQGGLGDLGFAFSQELETIPFYRPGEMLEVMARNLDNYPDGCGGPCGAQRTH